ncbi:DUF421 domain-containing protein [Cohnella thailandensis]|uniref:DUF421 domain-containing protein n=1 Tax=Cohnella thailandensis TaxID=557557 RepID=A0A841T4F9_9BACL|nr:DUF421 domain-containing protein [Cohnella thailandensis]MBB6637515.1 DUF421 domain-containing protein [Cohnella thailandensis]MBP1977548.1 uncharacterized membrane protein YcaP (DUF421 family) [Cohnella thailandensis]
MQDYAEIATKLAIAFAGLWAMTRLLGKREIAQLTPFDFVSSLVLGDLVGNTIYDEQASFWKLLFALAFWAALSYAFEKIMEFGKPFRRRLEGKPELLIVDGEIDLAAMKRNSMEFEELRMMLRQRDVFSVSEVAYAIYETNGSLSVLRKSAYEEVSRSDLHLDSPKAVLSRSLVEKGVVQPQALAAIGRDETWLSRELQALGFADIRTVALAEWTEEGKLEAIPSVRKSC